jgi:hypothetical protein
VTDEDDSKPMKALYDHCISVYEAMEEDAVPEEGVLEGVGATEDIGYMIWTGHTTQIFAKLGMATPYYTSVMSALKKMGCVEQVKRGGGNSMSKWRLVRRPEEEAFLAAEKIKTPVQGSQKALEQQVRDLTARVNTIQEAVRAIAELLPAQEPLSVHGTTSGLFEGDAE